MEKKEEKNMYSILIPYFVDVILSAPLQGGVTMDALDEAYARVHIGIFGVNIDIFLARFCFHGYARYNLNIIKVSIGLFPQPSIQLIHTYQMPIVVWDCHSV